MLTHLHKLRYIALSHRNRVDDLDACDVDLLAFGDTSHFIGSANQYRNTQATLMTDRRRFHRARFIAFRQNDTLSRLACAFRYLVTKGRWRHALGKLTFNPRLQDIHIQMTGHVIQSHIKTLNVVPGNKITHTGELSRGRKAIGIDTEHGEPLTKGRCAQFNDFIT